MEYKKEKTITCGAGRFLFDVPISMNYRGGIYSMRTFEIRENVWPEGDSEKMARKTWDEHLSGINALEPPLGKEKALIEVKELPDIANQCVAVFYNKEKRRPNRGHMDIFLNAGVTGVWITSFGKVTGKDFMYEKSIDLAKAYRPPAHRSGNAAVLKNVDAFYLQYGAIDLPFEYRESIEIGFKGHKLDEHIELEIETDVVGEVEPNGVMEKFKAMTSTNYAPGLKIKKIRTQKRTLAGMKGEEVIFQGTEEGEQASSLYFKWEFPGRESDPHFPNIIIDMQAKDDKRDEKIANWDSILDSLRPAGR